MAAAPPKEARRILILNEGGVSYPAITLINQGIQTALQDSPYRFEFYSEYLDTILFPDPRAQQEFRDFYLRKYENRQPDVIITVGPSPLKFMQEVHQKAFPGTPIVFCLPAGSVPGAPALDSDFTGIENDIAPAKTLEIALRLQPDTRHVVVVGGVSKIDKQQLAFVMQRLKGFTDHLDITPLTDLAMPDLLERIRHLPPHTLILFVSVSQDAAGTRFKSNETAPLVAAAANAPIFSLYDVYINHGEVGGYLSNLYAQGEVAGGMALRILNGEKPHDIPRAKAVMTYMFDWRALKRWDLKESALLPGSVILNRQPSAWELYKWYIIGGISLMLLESLLIFGLLLQRLKRRRAENELALSHDRLRMAVEAGKSVGWDWDVKGGTNQWFGDLQTMFGIPGHSYPGSLADFRRRVHPDDLELVSKAIGDARESQKPYLAEFRVIRNDQTVRWITANGRFYYAGNGDPVRMLGIAVDITERKMAEEAVKKSEEKFSKAFRESPMALTLTSVINQRYLDVNETFEQITGWRRDEVIGRTPFDLRIWVDPAQWATFVRRLKAHGAVRNMEVSFRCKDGTQRIALGSAELIEIEHEQCVLSVIADITDRKLAEEALSDIGRRLIEAHEEERGWIARELHDDINQRIAMLAIELEQCDQHLPEPGGEVHDRIRQVRKDITSLGKDIQALSHRLHSSKLEYLGLAAAANSFCEELSQQQNVEIDFSHSGISHEVPKDISLCLFRVLQEALQNAVKHSGVRHFSVELRGTSEDIQLRVSDLGTGFDQQHAMNRRGLGLISMRERLQLVNGDFSIESQPGLGTTVYARVPLRPKSHRASIAG